jgi:hypothetical protein
MWRMGKVQEMRASRTCWVRIHRSR